MKKKIDTEIRFNFIFNCLYIAFGLVLFSEGIIAEKLPANAKNNWMTVIGFILLIMDTYWIINFNSIVKN